MLQWTYLIFIGGNMKIFLLVCLFLVACKPTQVETENITEEITENITEEITETEYNGDYSLLTGLPKEEGNNSRIYGVMIDNKAEARPQSGLSKASIIYEYEVESSITRYMALFENQNVEKIGPIRSARPYFIDTLKEYDAMYVRFGGSSDADAEIELYGVPELDGMKNGNNIWRDSSNGKVAPHNAFSSSESILEYMENMGYQTQEAEGVFSFNREITSLQGEGLIEANDISLSFNDYETMEYKYDEGQGNYLRLISGEAQVDEYYGDEIRPQNILILFMDMGNMEDDVHRWMGHIGEGSGLYITGGKARNIVWSKYDRFEKTHITYENGEEVLLNPGQTWVENFDINKVWKVN